MAITIPKTGWPDSSLLTHNIFITDNTSGPIIGPGLMNAAMTGPIGPSAPAFSDNRPTIVEKRLAIKIVVSAFERRDGRSENLDVMFNANRKLEAAVRADTRCGTCERLTYMCNKAEMFEKDATAYTLTAVCKTISNGVTHVICPDGRTTSLLGRAQTVELAELPDLTTEVTKHQPEVSNNPDVPKTAMDESW